MIKHYYTTTLSFISLLLLLGFNTHAQSWAWAQAPQGGVLGIGYDVAVDSKGNAYISGDFRGHSISFGNYTLYGDTAYTGFNMYIAKYDSFGNVLWAATSVFDTSSTTYLVNGYNVATDMNDNAIVTGAFYTPSITFGPTTFKQGTDLTDRLFIVKYSPSGVVLWAKQVGGSVASTRVVTDKQGEIYITGSFTSAIATFGAKTLSDTGGTGFLVKYDSLGNVKWARNIRGSSGYGLAADSSYNLFVTGAYIDSITLGATQLKDSKGTDFFLAKYDSAGTVLWATGGGANVDAGGASVSTDATGNAYLTGFYNDTLRVGPLEFPKRDKNGFYSFVLKYSPAGNLTWGSSINTGKPFVISTGANGNSYISGQVGKDSVYQFPSIVDFNTTSVTVPANSPAPMYVAEYDSAGNVMCASALESGAFSSNSVAISNSGYAYVSGDFYETPFTIGNFTLTFDTTGPQGIFSQQIFLGKYSCSTTNAINTVYNPQAPFSIFPNPGAGDLYVATDGKEGIVTVTNIVGQVVYESNVAATYFDIPVSNLSSGIYLVRLQTADGSGVRKWVKE